MLKQLIPFIEGLQQKIDFEGFFLLGIGFDRWAHFLIALLLMILFHNYPKV